MATWAEKYVDLSAGSNGTGTSGSPWNSFDNAVTGLGTVSVPTRVNVKGSQTTATGANIALSTAGLASSKCLWWRGYISTIGDLDNNFDTTTANFPTLTVQTGFRISLSTGWQRFSNLKITGNYDFAGLFRNAADGPVGFTNCKITNASANAVAAALGNVMSGNYGVSLIGCTFTANAAASGALDHQIGPLFANGCEFLAAIAGVNIPNTGSTVNATFVNCIFKGATYGVLCATPTLRPLILVNCTFYNPSSDALRVSAAPDSGMVVVQNCLFSTVGGYAVKNTSGADFGIWPIDCPDYYSITSGQTNGLTDDAATADGSGRNIKTEGSNPLTNTGAGDYTPVSGSSAIANAYPGQFQL